MKRYVQIKEVYSGKVWKMLTPNLSENGKTDIQAPPVQVLTLVTLTLIGILLLLTQCKTTEKRTYLEIKKEVTILREVSKKVPK